MRTIMARATRPGGSPLFDEHKIGGKNKYNIPHDA